METYRRDFPEIGNEKEIYSIINSAGEIVGQTKPNETVKIVKVVDRTDFTLWKKVAIKGKRFVKDMFDEREIMLQLRDNPMGYMALHFLKFHIMPETNAILLNGKKYKAVDLAREMGITRQTATVHLKRLEALNIIKFVPTNKGNIMFMNPNVFAIGDVMPEKIIDLFSKAKIETYDSNTEVETTDRVRKQEAKDGYSGF